MFRRIINTLESLRLEIDKIDTELLHILARRMAIVVEIGKFKKKTMSPSCKSTDGDQC